MNEKISFSCNAWCTASMSSVDALTLLGAVVLLDELLSFCNVGPQKKEKTYENKLTIRKYTGVSHGTSYPSFGG